MKCEIEFLAVGSASCAGDAIIVRYGDESAYELMLIDGGHAETGVTLVSHLKKHFGDDVTLENVVLTHSDADHASGLRTVLREIPVENLWLHIPWLLAEEARHLFQDKRWTEDGLLKNIKAEYSIISEILEIAVEEGTKIYYPFEGSDIGPFRVCSPTRYAYLHLLPQFDKTPAPDQEQIEALNMWLGKESLLQKMIESARAATEGWVTETWENERLKDGGLTSASNETSVVLYGDFGDGRRVLLTGDAGVNALTWAADYADQVALPLREFSFVQIPHHGSRRNVGPTILDRLLGQIQAEAEPTRFSAFVSAPADDSRHPRKMVTNAFRRRGGKIIATQGQNKVHYGGFAKRAGYVDVTPLPFYTEVEDYT